jgi:hypothetical protein
LYQARSYNNGRARDHCWMSSWLISWISAQSVVGGEMWVMSVFFFEDEDLTSETIHSPPIISLPNNTKFFYFLFARRRQPDDIYYILQSNTINDPICTLISV